MEIRRPALAAAFAAFEARGSGVVIGLPGVGKSHLLTHYAQDADRAGRRSCLLALDKHHVRNDAELQVEFGMDGDLIHEMELDQAATEQRPGLFVIDSYDALRSEDAQRFVLNLIRRAKNKLGRRWRIVVSVRTFDAVRSANLLNLFPSDRTGSGEAFQLAGVHCRHFAIPTLSDAETEAAVATIDGLAIPFANGSQEFKRLLHVPFNLWLAEQLLRHGVELDRLSAVSSEVQLLSMFWRQRVEAGNDAMRRHALLTLVTRRMVEARELSLRLEPVFGEGPDDVWRDLFSAAVLVKPDTAGQRVAYAHNILFDFAVSVLLIEDDAARVAAFLSAEPARPVFLRPSIDYYFTRLWFENRRTFWTTALTLLASKDPHLRLFGRLIPMAVVAREARQLEEFEPMVAELQADTPNAPDAALRLLQARRAITPPRSDLWLHFFDLLSQRLHRAFAWDLAVQTFELIDGDVADVPPLTGTIARRILQWVWQIRNEQPWSDSLGSFWATRLAVRTFCTSPGQSIELLRPIIEATETDPSFPLEYLRQVVSGVEHIWPCSPEFAVEVYARTFAHREESRAPTSMGSPVLPLRSHRSQDFEMCLYELGHHFEAFLAADVQHALIAGIISIDRRVEEEHVTPYLREGRTLDDVSRRFSFGTREAVYVRDFSESWRSTGYRDHNLTMGDAVLDRLNKSAEAGDEQDIDRFIRLFIDHARMAFWWSALLAVGAKYPALFAQRLFPMCVSEGILTAVGSAKELTDFVVAAYPFWTPEQRQSYEDAVIALPSTADDEGRSDRRAQRLLGLLPANLVATAAARDARDEWAASGHAVRNDPLVKFEFSSGPVEEDDWLRERGVNPDEPANRAIKNATRPLEDFQNQWRNSVPSVEVIEELLPALGEAVRLIERHEADPAVIVDARTDVNGAAKLAARRLQPEHPGFALVRRMLLNAAQNPAVRFDEPENEDKDSPSWSPRPETEAAEGLPWLAMRGGADAEVLAAIESLSGDFDATIRYLAVRELFRIADVAPQFMWRILLERIETDRSPIVRLAISEALARLGRKHQEQVSEAVRRLWVHLPPDSSSASNFRDLLLDIVIWLRFERHDPWATAALDELADAPRLNPRALESAVFKMWHKVLPSRLHANPAGAAELLRVLASAVHNCCVALAERNPENDEADEDAVKALYGVLDESVSHAHFCVSPKHSRDGDANDEQKRRFFELVAPILDRILAFALDRGFILASTVHHLMQMLNEVVTFDARRAVIMAAKAAQAGRGANYNIDSLAVREVVKLVETVLADHRAEVQGGQALESLMGLLDVFAATGWPEAIKLVWRLDDLYR